MWFNWQQKVLAIGIGTFVCAALVGPFASHPAYSSITHSVSELAGQSMPNAWIMRAGFVAFGGAVLLAAFADLRANPAVNAALCLFGAGMVGSAIWSPVPIAAVGGGSRAEDDLHSIAASMMGAAFAFACAARFWVVRAGAASRGSTDWFSAAGVVIAVVIPVLMFQFPAVTGALQRGMFMFSFVWIAATLRPNSKADSPGGG
jgi:hypothetical protein